MGCGNHARPELRCVLGLIGSCGLPLKRELAVVAGPWTATAYSDITNDSTTRPSEMPQVFARAA